jgi:hypothetical protein
MSTEPNRAKRPRGRPVATAPEPIPDTPENIIKTVVRTRSQSERDRMLKKSGPGIEPLLERQPQEPAPSAPSQEPAPSAPSQEPAPSAPSQEPAPSAPSQEPAPSAPSQEPRRKDFEAPEPSRRETPGGPPPAEPPPENDNLLLEVYQ